MDIDLSMDIDVPRFKPPVSPSRYPTPLGWKISQWRHPVTAMYEYGAIMDEPINLETEAKILNALIKLLFIESSWTQGALCRLGGGKSWTRVQDMEVKSWCLVGALDLIITKAPALLRLHADRLYNKLNGTVQKMGFRYLEDFNDDTRVTHAHVMRFLDKARSLVK